MFTHWRLCNRREKAETESDFYYSYLVNAFKGPVCKNFQGRLSSSALNIKQASLKMAAKDRIQLGPRLLFVYSCVCEYHSRGREIKLFLVSFYQCQS